MHRPLAALVALALAGGCVALEVETPRPPERRAMGATWSEPASRAPRVGSFATVFPLVPSPSVSDDVHHGDRRIGGLPATRAWIDSFLKRGEAEAALAATPTLAASERAAARARGLEIVVALSDPVPLDQAAVLDGMGDALRACGSSARSTLSRSGSETTAASTTPSPRTPSRRSPSRRRPRSPARSKTASC